MKPKDYAHVWLKFSWWEFCAGRVYLNATFLYFFSFYLWEHVEVYSVHFFFTFLYFFVYIFYKMTAIATSILGKDRMSLGSTPFASRRACPRSS